MAYADLTRSPMTHIKPTVTSSFPKKITSKFTSGGISQKHMYASQTDPGPWTAGRESLDRSHLKRGQSPILDRLFCF